MSISTAYRVDIKEAALRDLADLMDFLRTVKSRESAHRYIDVMTSEVQSLSIFADLYRPSAMADIRRIHPKARRMVSHNRRWVYVFHIEGDLVVVDRIRPAKTIKG